MTDMPGMSGMSMHKHKMDTHNMMMVGVKNVYLSHLPMFEGNHVFQVIMKASLKGATGNPQQAYADDRRNNPKTKMYTFAPDPDQQFVLEDLFTPDPQHPKRSEFVGTVFRGHLERKPRSAILPNTTVHVNRVIYAQMLPLAKKPDHLEYLLFGEDQELFLAHVIGAPPDFDQLLSVQLTGSQFTADQLAAGVHVVIPSKKNIATDRIHENEQAQGTVQVPGTAAQTIKLQAGTEFYFEEGELQEPAIFDHSTPEEIKAGF